MESPKLFLKNEDINPTFIHQHIIPRLVTSRKGDNGIVLVIGGSKLYHGAPILSSFAALRTGIDLIFTAVPESNIQVTRSFSPNFIVLPIEKDKLTISSTNTLLELLPKKPDSVAIGMGMLIDDYEGLKNLIRQLLDHDINKHKRKSKLLLDASALVPEILDEISSTNTIITPHPGEYERIFKNDDGDIIGLTFEQQISNVRKNATRYGITIILKGFNNIICEGSSDRVAVIRRTNPSMTVGGTGDTLSGITAALSSKIESPFYASILAVYFSGKASDIAYSNMGLHLAATDIIEKLPDAMKPFDIVID
jgi:NAD(P)H-hydrate epimerase